MKSKSLGISLRVVHYSFCLPCRVSSQEKTFLTLTEHRSCLHFTTLDDRHVLVGFVPHRASLLNHAHNIHAVDDLTEDNVLVVQERRGRCGNEELATICVWARVLGDFSD